MAEPLKMDIEAIMRHLPHRYPFLLVDRVLACEAGQYIHALKNVTFNEPFFPGHFPHRPLMPGVMIIEALAQTAGILAFKTVNVVPNSDTRFYFVAIDNARFRKPVEPGDQLILKVTLKRAFKGIWKFHCLAAGRRSRGGLGRDHGGARSQGARYMIDPRAVVSPQAEIAADVEIGPFSVIGPEVAIGPGSWIGPHAVINGPTRIGADNKVFQFASIGDVPQDKKYKGERTRLEIGDRNVFRECVTVNRGTAHGGGVTRIGNDNLFMAYAHVAHDCQLGDQIVMANCATLAGHVELGDWVIMGGLSAVHQFTKIGAHGFLAHNAAVTRDVPPYVMAVGRPAVPHSVNLEGLRRRGFTAGQIQNIRRAFRVLYRSGLKLSAALEELEKAAESQAEIRPFVDFIKLSSRSIVR